MIQPNIGMFMLILRSMERTMNYLELIESVSDITELTKADVKRVFEAQRVVIQDHLKSAPETDNGISLPGIGKIKVKKRAARKGVNPYTGEKIKIKAKRVPTFSAASTLKDLVSRRRK